MMCAKGICFLILNIIFVESRMLAEVNLALDTVEDPVVRPIIRNEEENEYMKVFEHKNPVVQHTFALDEEDYGSFEENRRSTNDIKKIAYESSESEDDDDDDDNIDVNANIEEDEEVDSDETENRNACAILVVSNSAQKNHQIPALQSLLRKYRYDEKGDLIPKSVKYFFKIPQGSQEKPRLIELHDKSYSPLEGLIRCDREIQYCLKCFKIKLGLTLKHKYKRSISKSNQQKCRDCLKPDDKEPRLLNIFEVPRNVSLALREVIALQKNFIQVDEELNKLNSLPKDLHENIKNTRKTLYKIMILKIQEAILKHRILILSKPDTEKHGNNRAEINSALSYNRDLQHIYNALETLNEEIENIHGTAMLSKTMNQNKLIKPALLRPSGNKRTLFFARSKRNMTRRRHSRNPNRHLKGVAHKFYTRDRQARRNRNLYRHDYDMSRTKGFYYV